MSENILNFSFFQILVKKMNNYELELSYKRKNFQILEILLEILL